MVRRRNSTVDHLLGAWLWMALLAISLTVSPARGRAEAVSHCSEENFEDSKLTVCSFDPTKTKLRMFWKAPDGAPLKSFARLAEEVTSGGKQLVFAVNGGMYSESFEPVGLYIEDGHELRPVNTKTMTGSPGSIPNFYKKPNGIFFLTGSDAGILTTEEYLSRPRTVQFATQSGPMLVMKNELHPALIPGSTDKTRRSGVGISKDGIIHFAISEDDINFHAFARFFRDQMKCPNALFLDGGRGAGIYSEHLGRSDWSWHGGFGPMIGVVE